MGPSYPLVFHPNLSRQFAAKKIAIPAAWHAMFGSRIVLTSYSPLENSPQSPGSMRVDVEIHSLEKMIVLWQKGIVHLEKSLPRMPAGKKSGGENLVNLGRFIRNCIRTTINVKKWWKLNQQLIGANDQAMIRRLLKDIEALARKEIANAEDTIPLVEKDSRLGWEPSMDYMTDAEHLRWKIAQVRAVLAYELPEYQRIAKL